MDFGEAMPASFLWRVGGGDTDNGLNGENFSDMLLKPVAPWVLNEPSR